MLYTLCRHCLLILGNAPTLANSGTVWAKLVSNAKVRRCLYNVEDGKHFAQAIVVSLVEHGYQDGLLISSRSDAYISYLFPGIKT